MFWGYLLMLNVWVAVTLLMIAGISMVGKNVPGIPINSFSLLSPLSAQTGAYDILVDLECLWFGLRCPVHFMVGLRTICGGRHRGTDQHFDLPADHG